MTRTSLLTAASTAVAVALAVPAVAQDSAQRLLERGAYTEVVFRVETERQAGNSDPASTYAAGQALLRLDRNGDARSEFAKLSNSDDEAWKAVGQSAIALLDNNVDEAVNEARRARDVNGDLGYAHYQLGQALIRHNQFNEAAQVLDRATELMPDYAYAFYHAGVAHQRARQFDKMAEHFKRFLQLAPDAPERRMVQAALTALRG